MPATVRVSIATGATPTVASAETGIKFNREDTQVGTTPIPVPTSTGTHFSYPKWLYLDVTGTSTTSISNRKVYSASAPQTGFNLWYKAAGTTYTQASGNADADAGTNGATPTGYTAMASSAGGASAYDAASVATSGAGRNGQYTNVALGVDNTYAAGANSAAAVPNIIYSYDES